MDINEFCMKNYLVFALIKYAVNKPLAFQFLIHIYYIL